MAGPNPPVITSNNDFSNASLFKITDPQGWGVGTLPATGQEGYLKYFSEKDIADSAKVATKHELNWAMIKDAEIGVSYSQRYKYAAQNPTGYLVNSSGQPTAPLGTLTGTTDLSYAGNLKPISWNADGLLNSGALTLLQNPNPGTFVGDDFKVNEDITRPYVQAGLKGTVGGVPYEGNIGVVANITKQSSTGLSAGGGTLVTPASASASYVDVLPSLNLIFKARWRPRPAIRTSSGSPRAARNSGRACMTCGPRATTATTPTLPPPPPSARGAGPAATRTSARGRPIPSTWVMNTTSPTARATSRWRCSTRSS